MRNGPPGFTEGARFQAVALFRLLACDAIPRDHQPESRAREERSLCGLQGVQVISTGSDGSICDDMPSCAYCNLFVLEGEPMHQSGCPSFEIRRLRDQLADAQQAGSPYARQRDEINALRIALAETEAKLKVCTENLEVVS